MRVSRLTLCSFERTWFTNIGCLLFVHRISAIDQASTTGSMSIHGLVRSIFLLIHYLRRFIGRASYTATQRISPVGIADFPMRRRSCATYQTQLFYASFMYQHLCETTDFVPVESIKRQQDLRDNLNICILDGLNPTDDRYRRYRLP